MIVFQLILLHRTIVYVTETSPKMASTLSQKQLNIFVQNIVYFLPYNFVQMLRETLDFRYQRQ